MGAIVKSDVTEKDVLLIEKPVILDVEWTKESRIPFDKEMILITKGISEARLKCERRKQEYQTLLKHYQQIMYDRYHVEIYGRVGRSNTKSNISS